MATSSQQFMRIPKNSSTKATPDPETDPGNVSPKTATPQTTSGAQQPAPGAAAAPVQTMAEGHGSPSHGAQNPGNSMAAGAQGSSGKSPDDATKAQAGSEATNGSTNDGDQGTGGQTPPPSESSGKSDASKTDPATQDGQAGGSEADDTGSSNSRKTVTHTWKSGDFLDKPRDTAPYNGIMIVGSYDEKSDGTFGALKIVFTDYTLSKDGVTSTIPALRVGDSWTEVPEPSSTPAATGSAAKAKDSASPSGSSTTAPDSSGEDATASTFTIMGEVRIQTVPGGRFLRVRLQYGKTRVREELGFIFKLGADSQPTPKAQ